ncbi:hypothetical protein AKAW_05152 [Aspergillus luchuensis IFO 4308]|nr:hypothetical protein AKAW_05152 [Aspergillus luchuensis IFO 4308]
MSFHYVDKGLARFLQVHTVLVFEEAFDPLELKHCFEQLVQKWPILQARLNFLRTGTFSTSQTHSFFQHRVIDATLAETVPVYPMIHQSMQEDDYKRLMDLTSIPCSIYTTLFPPVISQGMSMIGWAYAALLSGNPIDIPDFDRPVTLQFNAAPNNPSNPHYCHDPSPSTLSNGSNRLYSGGLSHFTLGLLWHRLAPASCSNTGSSRMMHIPALVIDQLADHATKQGIRISRVDILMAMILQANVRVFPHDSTTTSYPLAFMLNFNHLLVNPAKFHNSFWPVPIPRPPGLDPSQVSHESTINLAAHIRRVTRVAQSAECLEDFNAQYQRMGPWHLWHPRAASPSHPRTMVTSMAHSNPYNLASNSGVRPLFFDNRIETMDLAQYLGIYLHGAINVNLDRNGKGFCLTGSLHPHLWRELEKIRDGFLYRSDLSLKSKL